MRTHTMDVLLNVLLTIIAIAAIISMLLNTQIIYKLTTSAEILQPSAENKMGILSSETVVENPVFISVSETEEIQSTAVEEPLPESDETMLLSLPDMPTNMHLYTDYRSYNLTGTPHYRLQQKCYTDEYGCRRFGEDYVIGLGTFYSTDIGDRFEITLDNGNTFTAILGDTKADKDTDISNRYTECVNYDGEPCANVLEFIVDSERLEQGARDLGTLTYYEHLNGNVTAIRYLGRDESDDWGIYY